MRNGRLRVNAVKPKVSAAAQGDARNDRGHIVHDQGGDANVGKLQLGIKNDPVAVVEGPDDGMGHRLAERFQRLCPPFVDLHEQREDRKSVV